MNHPTKKYIESLYRPKLNKNQREKLVDFILEFLPNTGEKRRYKFNSLQKIHITIDRIFMEHSGFGVSEKEVIDTFLELDYTFRTIVAKNSNITPPSSVGFYAQVYEEFASFRKKHPNGILHDHEFNISVSASDIKLLYYSQNRIPLENGNFEKTIQPRIKMKKAIRTFFGLSDEITPEDVVPKTILNPNKEG